MTLLDGMGGGISDALLGLVTDIGIALVTTRDAAGRCCGGDLATLAYEVQLRVSIRSLS